MAHYCLGLSISPRQWHLLLLHKIQISQIPKKKKKKYKIIPPSSPESSTEIVASESSDASQLKVASENVEHSVQETTAIDEQPATFIHPWDGPPAKEPVYPPGTYRGMF